LNAVRAATPALPKGHCSIISVLEKEKWDKLFVQEKNKAV
jgi:hypothetical protein